MSRMLRGIPVVFQQVRLTSGCSKRHARDMDQKGGDDACDECTKRDEAFLVTLPAHDDWEPDEAQWS
jgi:hypothetical protein